MSHSGLPGPVLEEIYRTLLEQAVRALGATRAAILSPDEAGEEARVVAAYGFEPRQPTLSLQINEDISSRQIIPIEAAGVPVGYLFLEYAPPGRGSHPHQQEMLDLITGQLAAFATRRPWWEDYERERLASRALLQVNERELQRIILDIHDGPVQNMFAALSQLNLLEKALTRHNGGNEQTRHALKERVKRVVALRDLIRLVQSAAVGTEVAGKGRITKAIAMDAANELRRWYAGHLSARYHEELIRTHKSHQLSGTAEGDELLRVNMILSYLNKDVWFDAHPILWPLLEAES